METKSGGRFNKVLLIIIAIGIWIIVFQKAGFIPTSQNVRVTNSVDVYGTVDVDDMSGYIDVNLASINGKSNAFYDYGGNKNYIRIPVYTGY